MPILFPLYPGFLPEVPSPDDVMPCLSKCSLPNAGLQLLSWPLSPLHCQQLQQSFISQSRQFRKICLAAKATRLTWFCGIVFCILLSGGCAQIGGTIDCLALHNKLEHCGCDCVGSLCRPCQSLAGAAQLLPGQVAALDFSCMLWYLLANKSFAVVPIFWQEAALIPPFCGFHIFASWLVYWLESGL